jgi:hypothetical protein
VLGPDGYYQQVRHTGELVTVDRPWEMTLDLPAWTRRRDRFVRWPGRTAERLIR